jgi:hypothetical protein
VKPLDKIPLRSFEHIARARGRGTFVVGCLLVGLWFGGHGALYGAFRVTEAKAAEKIAAAGQSADHS